MVCVTNLLISVTLLLSKWKLSEAKDRELYCGACHMIADELSYEIARTDPLKIVQTGSFRINPDGSQVVKKIPYLRSSIQLTELLDGVCKFSKDYLQTTAEGSQRKIYTRQNRRDGAPNSVKNVVISSETNKMLQFACETLVEDFEDEIMAAFKNSDDDNYLRTVCVDVTETCTDEELYDVNTEAVELQQMQKEMTEGKGDNSEEDSEDIDTLVEESEDKSDNSKDNSKDDSGEDEFVNDFTADGTLSDVSKDEL